MEHDMQHDSTVMNIQINIKPNNGKYMEHNSTVITIEINIKSSENAQPNSVNEEIKPKT